MSRKKKEQRKDDKLQKYDEEPATPVFFNEKRSEPKPIQRRWRRGIAGMKAAR